MGGWPARPTRTISQRELRDDSGAIRRALDRGEAFGMARNGIPAGELHRSRSRSVHRDVLIETHGSVPAIDAGRLRADVGAVLAQDIDPRA